MRLGVCTGGGDCQGLNAAVRAIYKHASQTFGFEVVGLANGIEGLIDNPPQILTLTQRSVQGILEQGGTILGTTNSGSPFRGDTAAAAKKAALDGWKKSKLDALIVIGGDGTQGMARELSRLGLNIVGVPKTIDNDFGASDYSIGFSTSVEIAADAVSRLQSTAESHSRLMIAEVMGRDAGFIALHAGIAGGANVILLPEIPFDYDAIIRTIEERRSRDRNFAVLVVAEGAHAFRDAKKFKENSSGKKNLGGVGDTVARELYKRTGMGARVTVLGHIQRGGSPNPYDRVMATAFGTHAVDLIAAKKFGRVVVQQNGRITDVAYTDIKNGTRSVDMNDELLRAAEAVGICLGRPSSLKKIKGVSPSTVPKNQKKVRGQSRD